MGVMVSDNKVELKDLMETADSLPPAPRLAQVIKRSTPVDEFLKQTKENV